MGPPSQMNTINTSGTGAITATKARDSINRTYGGFATYDIGKVLVAGGGRHYRGRSNPRPDQDRRRRQRQRRHHHGYLHRLYVGWAAPAQSHRSG